jgi:hypothetical protein
VKYVYKAGKQRLLRRCPDNQWHDHSAFVCGQSKSGLGWNPEPPFSHHDPLHSPSSDYVTDLVTICSLHVNAVYGPLVRMPVVLNVGTMRQQIFSDTRFNIQLP